MRCGIPNAYILDITMYKMHVYSDVSVKHNNPLLCFLLYQDNMFPFL